MKQIAFMVSLPPSHQQNLNNFEYSPSIRPGSADHKISKLLILKIFKEATGFKNIRCLKVKDFKKEDVIIQQLQKIETIKVEMEKEEQEIEKQLMMKDIQETHQAFTQKFHQQNVEIVDLKDTVSGLQQRIKNLKSLIESYTKELQQIQKKQPLAETHKEILAIQIKDGQKKGEVVSLCSEFINENMVTIQKLNQENLELQDKIQYLQKQRDEREKLIKKKNEWIKQLKTDANRQKAEIEKLKQQNEEMKTAENIQKEENEQLKKQNEEIQQLQEAKKIAENLSKKIEQLKNNVKEKEKVILRQIQDLKCLSQKLEQLKSEKKEPNVTAGGKVTIKRYYKINTSNPTLPSIKQGT